MFYYLVLFLCGIVNGLFTSSAGQILVFYYIYIMHLESQNARQKALIMLPIVSIPTCIYYLIKSKNEIELKTCAILIIISIIFGLIGNKIMNKIKGNILNFISGIFLILSSLFGIWRTICYM